MRFHPFVSIVVYLPSGRTNPPRVGWWRRFPQLPLLLGLLLGLLTVLGGLGVPVQAQEAAGNPSPLAPFVLTPEMRQWAHQVADGIRAPEVRLRRLWRALLDPHRGGLVERTLPTPTALEAFRDKRANCVGLATLLVALGREMEVPAFFVTVSLNDGGEARGDLRLKQEHLAAAVGPSHAVRIFDFGGEMDGAHLRWRPVSDLTALALFHSNRGVEALLDGDTATAAESLHRAVRFDPALPVAWVNLGVALRRRGDGAGAEEAYRQALRLDPEATAAYHNLAALLAQEGRASEAAHLAEEARRLEEADADPLRYLHRARRYLEGGEIEAARRWYEKALALAQSRGR